ncbi:MAG TPA: amidohydrolase family protein [Acidimicrobiales bacterium]|nr:amidohydrolase family protein [Acidimicrobiales bacterium]
MLIKGATIVDGTGRPGVRGNVAVRDGRIAEVGADAVGEPGEEVVEADGLVVAPGFVDPHTHYDAQLMWDPYATPSNEHGVTTVIGGNCGFTLAPLKPEDADYTRRMMSKVEGMPLAALEAGVDWSWQSFAEYLDRLDGRIAVNAGFLVGHCALRRYVMGPSSVEGPASDAQVAQMVSLLHESLAAGGLGFSTTRSSSHSDGDGVPVASRHATEGEVLALCQAVSEHEGTTLEAIVQGCLDMFSDDEIALFTNMSATARRPLNWNVLTVDASVPERVPRQLSASDAARAAGGRVVALTMPVLVPMNMSFGTFCALFLVPGWGDVMNLPIPERIEALRQPSVRADLNAKIDRPEAGVFRRLGTWKRYVIGDTYSPANAGLRGRVVGDIAAERGQEPFDTLLDIVLNDDLRTVLWPMPTDNNSESWDLRKEVWNDPRVMLGGSDAGAHLDRMCGAPYTTRFIGDMVRGRQLVPLERAVQMLTETPAQLFGLRDRGRIAPGYRADVVLFDPQTIGSDDATLVRDLPGGSARLTAGSQGVHRVLVNGVSTVVDGKATGDTPGTVLRAGRDTQTVLP